MIDLFRIAGKRPLTEDDVCEPVDFLSTEYNVQTFESSWKVLPQDEVNKEGSLLWHLMKHFRKQMIMAYTIYLTQDICKFFTLMALRYLVEYTQGTVDINATTSWLLLSAAVFMVILIGITGTNCARPMQYTEMRFRLILVALIYKKVLYLSHKSLAQTTPGHIVTLISADAEATNGVVSSLYSWFGAPVLLIMIMVFECLDIGPYILLTPVFLSVTVLFLYQWGKLAGKLRYKQERWTDKRVQLLNEMIVSMKVVKMYCWEKPFSAYAYKIRGSEMGVQLWRALVVAFGTVCGLPFVKIIMFVLVVYLVYTGHDLTTGQGLSLIGNMGLLHLILNYMGLSLTIYQEMKASTERIKGFLLKEEITTGGSDNILSPGLNIDDLTVSWCSHSKGQDEFSLQDVSLTAKQAELIAVVGKVGAGKSTLLTACLKELRPSKGSCEVGGTVSYAPQEPWILSETVRDNILLGNEFDEHKYNRVLSACALIEDLDHMPAGDQTLVGERGLTLSGGQKARVGLARAVYHEADIYLLDDPLSAVDGKVANQIFFKCIQNLLKDKIRVLATHQTHILGHSSKVVLLHEGYIRKCGAYKDMAQLVKEHIEVESKEDVDGLSQPLCAASEVDNNEITMTQPSGAITKVDQNESGGVGFSVYMRFLRAGKGFFLIPLFHILSIIVLASSVLHDLLLIQWGIDKNQQDTSGTNSTILKLLGQHSPPSNEWYLQTLGLCLCIVFVLHFSAYLAMVYMYKTAGKNLYSEMFNRLMKAPLHFFETNPVGQVLNRFSRDTAFMDYYLLRQLIVTTTVIVPMLETIYICIINPWCIIPLCIFIIAVVFLSKQLLHGVRETKRIEASLRSPMFSHLSTTLEGHTVIRAMKKEQEFLNRAYYYLDRHSSAWFNFINAEKGFSLTVDVLSALLTSFSIILLYVTSLNAYTVVSTGLALIYLPNNIAKITFAFLSFGRTEVMMTSIERILQYCKLEQEAPDYVVNRPPQGWPHQGNISLRDVSIRYHEQQRIALGPVSINIRAGEKIGLVGRTGAGKSSLLTCMMRLVEPEGSVVIDGININTIGLADLRGAISVIPQDPVVFSHSLRYNLDPFNEFNDDRLWDALNKAQLAGKVKELSGQLMAEMGESGSNFSVGEKQLLCLARAIMRDSKIVLIDEATANVDKRTDEIIQTTLRETLVDATVVTIAHRLNTLVAVDRIMVLEQGKVVEMGSPYRLLQQGSGSFYDMVKALGQANVTQLMKATHHHMKSKTRDDNSAERTSMESGMISQITTL